MNAVNFFFEPVRAAGLRTFALFLILTTLVLGIFGAETARAQGTLVPGELGQGTISPAGDTDTWTFNANAGDSIVVRVGELISGSTLYPWLRLYGPNSQLLSQNFNSAAAEVSFRATNSGTFTVVVADGNTGATGTGSYRMTLAKTGSAINVSAGDEGGPLTNGALTGGRIEVGDLDVWSFTASTGDNFVVRVGQVSSEDSLYPWLRLYGPDGRPLTENYNPAAAEVAFRATNSGTFIVIIGDGNLGRYGSGSYRMTLAKTGAPIEVSALDEGGSLTNGAMHTGRIEVGDVDVWSFTATRGDNLIVRIGELSSSETLYPWIRLFGPDGQLLVNSYNAAAAETAFRATNSGTFIVVVGDGNNGMSGVGSYRLTLGKTGSPVVVSPEDEGGPLTNGVMHTGRIEVGDVDLWTFTASAGDNLVVRMGELSSTETLYPWVRLFGPDGQMLDHSYNSAAAEAWFRATNSGIFTVVIGDGNSGFYGAGSYRLTLGRTGSPIVVSSGDEGGEMSNGLLYTGRIEVGDVDVYSFTANVGESLLVRVGELSSSETLYPWLRLFGPNGVLLSENWNSAAAEVGFRATNSGTFTVMIADGNSGIYGAGSYRLTMGRTGNAISVLAGDEGGGLTGGSVDGVIETGDLDLFSFTICANELIDITVSEAVANSGLYPWLRLYGRDGTLLSSVYGPATVHLQRLAPDTGNYVLVVGDGNSGMGGFGAYHLITSGLTADPKMCIPRLLAGNTTARQGGVGGPPGRDVVVVSAPTITTPASLWTPILTNKFGTFGELSFTNRINPALTTEFFRFYIP